MKKLILLVMLGFASTMATTAQAQVSINVNIGTRPYWTPLHYNYVTYRYVPVHHYAPSRRVHYVAPRHVNFRAPYMKHKIYKVKYKSHGKALKHYYKPKNHSGGKHHH